MSVSQSVSLVIDLVVVYPIQSVYNSAVLSLCM